MHTRAWIVAAAVGMQLVEQVVVKVNGDIITRTEIDARVRVALAQERGRGITPRELRADPQLRQEASDRAPRALLDALDELLLVQWARDRGLQASDDDVDRVIARLRQDNKIVTEEAFEALLIGEGISPEALRDSLHAQISVERVRQQESARVSVRDGEARDYYRNHPEEFPSSPPITFSEIFVAVPAGSERLRDEGLIRFVAAQDRVLAGEDFSSVARAVSEAPSRNDGGAVGLADLTALARPVQDALARLNDGEVSSPVKTDAGYFLLKLESRGPARPATFEAWSDAVVSHLLAVKRARAFAERLKILRAQALIEWKDRDLQAACAALSSRESRDP